MALSRSGRLGDSAGASQLGCILRLAVAVAVVWVAIKVVDPYFRYWQLKDQMGRSAEFANNLNDDEIRRRIVAEVQRLGLPKEAERVHITRRPNRDIVIWLEYSVLLQLPGYETELTFKPRVEATI